MGGTALWAVWESGFDAWALLPRIGLLSVLGIYLALPSSRRILTGGPVLSASVERAAGWFVILLICGIVGAAALQTSMVNSARGTAIAQSFVKQELGNASFPSAGADWRENAGNEANTLFSDLTDINPNNVGGLKVAWTYKFKGGAISSLEVTPIKVGDMLYACNFNNVVIALDPETGRTVWEFDPQIQVDFKAMHYKCRGVSYYSVPGGKGVCAKRIITSTGDARLFALDATSGKPCSDFGQGGQVSLRTGLGEFPDGVYWYSAAPIVARGLIILGGSVTDNRYWGEPSGVIRAFDAVTGSLIWAYDVGKPDLTEPLPPGDGFTPATPNNWGRMAYDDVLGLIYIPTGNATPDFFGARRRSFDDEISSSIMALEIETGRRRWIYQTVHHDLWDYDVGSPPILIDLPSKDGMIQALLQPTKRGETFLLDRLTGRPIDPVIERPAAKAGAAREERLSPTQPYPTSFPPLNGGLLSEKMMWGITPFDQLWCRTRFRQARYEGQMTPPGVTPSIVYPGFLGGSNWQGASIDPLRGVMLVVSNEIANYVRLIPRDTTGALDTKLAGGKLADHSDMVSGAPQVGTPYAASIGAFFSPLSIPCQQPPWSRVTAISMKTREVIWTRPLGTGKDNGPLGIRSHLPLTMGVPALGGALVTRSGLTFVAASGDRTFRAFETETGKLIWEHALPASGHATPMTYTSQSGRQFVVIAAGGHKMLKSELGDNIVAFAIP